MLNREFFLQLSIVLAVVLLQVFLFNNFIIAGKFHPLVFVMAILLMPLRYSYIHLILISFFLGLFFDFWMGSLGINAFCCLITAQLRNWYVKKVFEQSDDNFITLSDFSSASILIYMFIFTLFYNILLYTLQSFNFQNFLYSFGQGIINGIVSFVFMLVLYLLFRNRILR